MIRCNTKCILSVYLHLLKVTMTVTSCFAWFNNKNEKNCACTVLELQSLRPPDHPTEIIGISIDSQRLKLTLLARTDQHKNINLNVWNHGPKETPPPPL